MIFCALWWVDLHQPAAEILQRAQAHLLKEWTTLLSTVGERPDRPLMEKALNDIIQASLPLCPGCF